MSSTRTGGIWRTVRWSMTKKKTASRFKRDGHLNVDNLPELRQTPFIPFSLPERPALPRWIVILREGETSHAHSKTFRRRTNKKLTFTHTRHLVCSRTACAEVWITHSYPRLSCFLRGTCVASQTVSTGANYERIRLWPTVSGNTFHNTPRWFRANGRRFGTGV